MKIKFKSLAILTAILSLINSVFYLAVPVFSLMLLGRTTNPIGIMNTQVAGACGMGMFVINWSARNLKDKQVQRMVAWGNLTMFFFLVVVEIVGITTGAMNWVIWLFLLADSSFTLGHVIFLTRSYGSNS